MAGIREHSSPSFSKQSRIPAGIYFSIQCVVINASTQEVPTPNRFPGTTNCSSDGVPFHPRKLYAPRARIEHEFPARSANCFSLAAGVVEKSEEEGDEREREREIARAKGSFFPSPKDITRKEGEGDFECSRAEVRFETRRNSKSSGAQRKDAKRIMKGKRKETAEEKKAETGGDAV